MFCNVTSKISRMLFVREAERMAKCIFYTIMCINKEHNFLTSLAIKICHKVPVSVIIRNYVLQRYFETIEDVVC